MTTYRILGALCVLLVLPGASVLALDSVSQPVRVESLPAAPLAERPVVARVFFADLADLNRLTGELDVWQVLHELGYLVALLRPEQLTALRRAGYRVEIDELQTALLDQPAQYLAGQTSGIPGYPCYRTVEETHSDLSRLAADHPDLAAWLDVGDSWEKVTGALPGYDLHALVLTNRAVPGPKPKLLLMAAIHARELATAELAARFAERLVANYGIDPDVTWLLDYFELHVLPITNPDGRKQAESGEYWRKNTDDDDGCAIFPYYGTDLNRNSSFHWGGASTAPCYETYQGPSAASEPETQAIQNHMAGVFPDQRGPGDDDSAPDDATGVFITLHSYGEQVLFPYGFRPTSSPNHTQLETLGRKFGYFNGYEVCQSGEPGCIYATTGTTDDWAYGELGLAAYTFELGTAFFEGCSYFEQSIVPQNLPALLYAFKAARRPYQTPAGPESLDVTVTPTTTVAGTAVTLTAVADDTRYDSDGWGAEPLQNIAAARYTVDAPSWVTGVISYPLSPADGAFDGSVESVVTILDTTGWTPGRYIVFVEAQDADGNWGVPTAVFLWVTGVIDSAVAGTVREGGSDVPIAGATVHLAGSGLEQEQTTGVAGGYAFAVYSGTYTLTASAPNYSSSVLTQVVALSGVTTTQDVTVWPLRYHYLPLVLQSTDP
jgi:carboxypeptidase T